MWRQKANPNEASSDERLCEVTRRLSRARVYLNNALLELFEAYRAVLHHKNPDLQFDIVKQIVHLAIAMDVDDVARMIINDDNPAFSLKRRKYISDRVPGLPAALQRQTESRSRDQQ